MDDGGGMGGTGSEGGNGGSSDDASIDAPTNDDVGSGGGGSTGTDASDDTTSIDGGSDAGTNDAGAGDAPGCDTPWESGHPYALNDTASRICSDTASGANNCTVGTTYVWQCVYEPLCSSIAPGTSDSYAVWHVVRPCD
jgi:hypothetical protein